jgi:hypothetical protein
MAIRFAHERRASDQRRASSVASANAGGDPSQVGAPGDLAPPTLSSDRDLGSVNLNTPYYLAWWGSPLGVGWLYGTDISGGGDFGATWGDPTFYAWSNDASYGWGLGGSSANDPWNTWHNWLVDVGTAGGAWWGNGGMVAPSWGIFDPFGGGPGGYNGYYFVNGFGGFNYGLWFGAGFGYWYGNWGYYNTPGYGFGWLPYYSTLQSSRTGVDPSVAVQQEQASVDSLSAVAAQGEDTLTSPKNVAPIDTDTLLGVFQVGAAAGFSAITVGMEPPQTESDGSANGSTVATAFRARR